MKKIRSNVQKRRLQGVFVISLLSSLSLLYFGFLKPGKDVTTFGFVLNNEWVIIKEWVIASQTGARIFATISLIASAVAIFAYKKRSDDCDSGSGCKFWNFDVVLNLDSFWKIHSIYRSSSRRSASFDSTYFRFDVRFGL